MSQVSYIKHYSNNLVHELEKRHNSIYYYEHEEEKNEKTDLALSSLM